MEVDEARPGPQDELLVASAVISARTLARLWARQRPDLALRLEIARDEVSFWITSVISGCDEIVGCAR